MTRFSFTIELVDTSATCGPGLKVSGLGSGEESKALADEFGILNNDVIWKLNGTILSTTGRLATALDDLATQTEHDVVVKRRNGSSCDTTTYSLAVEPL